MWVCRRPMSRHQLPCVAPGIGVDLRAPPTHLKVMADDASEQAKAPASTSAKPRSPAAERALAEAAARRAERERSTKEQPAELHGRGGLDPVRYGDWEVKGIASDF